MSWKRKQLSKSHLYGQLSNFKTVVQNIFNKIMALLNVYRNHRRKRFERGRIEVVVFFGIVMYIEHNLSVGKSNCKGDLCVWFFMLMRHRGYIR